MKVFKPKAMKCPKCGRKLKIIHLKNGKFYGHLYTVSDVMGGKLLCDYSFKIKQEVQGNENNNI